MQDAPVPKTVGCMIPTTWNYRIFIIDNKGNHYVRWKGEKGWQKKNMGRDKLRALMRYEQWKAQVLHQEDFLSVEKPVYLSSMEAKVRLHIRDSALELFKQHNVNSFEFINEILEKVEINQIDIPISVCLKKAGEYILSNPQAHLKRAAKLMKIPEMEYLTSLEKPSPPLTLDNLLDIYCNQEKLKGKRTKEQQSELESLKLSWQRFCSILNIPNIREITFEMAQQYYSDIYAEFIGIDKYETEDPNSTTWLNHHIERVFRVINSGIKNTFGSDTEDVESFKKICAKAIKKVKTVKKNKPRKFKVHEFEKLLSVSNSEEKAMWLLSMNCAYYTVDIVTLPLSAIDFEDKIIVFRREKMEERGVGHRAAYLWDITIEAIKQYQSEYSHEGKTLFLNLKDKVPYVRKRIATKFRKCRERAKLDGAIVHPHFRDSVRSIGSSIQNQMSVDAVMGQKPIGNRADYIDPEEYPEISKQACMAVYDFYFGKQKKEK